MADKSQAKPAKIKLRSALGRLKYISAAPVRWVQGASLRPFGWLQGGPAAAIARLHRLHELTPEVVLAGYVQGIFPTGEADGSIVWHCPAERAVIDANQLHVSRRLKGYINKQRFRISYDQQFGKVMADCADRKKTWITSEIIKVYEALHETGFAHSVEAWNEDRLVGGGYGVALGSVFFLESMFCRENHASKVAFVQLARKLEADGFTAIDCQFLTEHWKRFGARPLPHEAFQALVTQSLSSPACFSEAKALPLVALPAVSEVEHPHVTH